MKSILVTGAAGFIGFHLSKLLLEAGYTVYGMDNINDYYSTNLKRDRLRELGVEPSNFEWNNWYESKKYPLFSFIRCDISKENDLGESVKNKSIDLIVNLAAQAGVRYSIENPRAYIQSNVTGFLNILELAKNINVDRLVYASSSSVYGESNETPFKVESTTDSPISVYAATKKSNEVLAHVYSHLFNISTVGLRFFTVYGPWGRPDMAPMLFAKAGLENREIRVYNNGNQKRDFTYVDDIVHGLKLVVDKPSKTYKKESLAQIHNIGKGKPDSLMDFITCLENNVGKPFKKKFVAAQPGDVTMTYADITSFNEYTGYDPRISLKEGIPEFVKWFKDYHVKTDK